MSPIFFFFSILVSSMDWLNAHVMGVEFATVLDLS